MKTQAQIEADNKRLRAALSDMVEITKRNSSPEIILTAIRTCASHALTAAAEVGEKQRCNHWPGQKRCEVCGMDLTAAAEVGPNCTVGSMVPCSFISALASAISIALVKASRVIIAATIERCAQKCDDMARIAETEEGGEEMGARADAFEEAAAAIRALRD